MYDDEEANGVKNLPIVTVVVLFNIDVSVSSINPVSLECLNELLNYCKSVELKLEMVVAIKLANSSLVYVVAVES